MKKGTAAENPKAPASAGLFFLFFGISAITVGGGYAMVPVIGSTLEKKGWVGEEDFFDLFAQAQSFPGPLAFTTALLVGKRLAGAKGAAAAGLGVMLPPFGAIVLVAALLGQIGELPPVRNFLKGAGATVPGLVAAMIWKVAKMRAWTPFRAISAIALSLLLCLLPAFTLVVFFAAILVLYFMEIRWNSSR